MFTSFLSQSFPLKHFSNDKSDALNSSYWRARSAPLQTQRISHRPIFTLESLISNYMYSFLNSSFGSLIFFIENFTVELRCCTYTANSGRMFVGTAGERGGVGGGHVVGSAQLNCPSDFSLSVRKKRKSKAVGEKCGHNTLQVRWGGQHMCWAASFFFSLWWGEFGRWGE